jgi:hypothetical protein
VTGSGLIAFLVMGRRTGGALLLAAVLSLVLAGAATAATRYAAPGGTGKDPCGNPARPCPVFVAADRDVPGTTIEAGDVVELAPGTYYADSEGEFGFVPSVKLPEGVTVRGEPGKRRPLIIALANESYGPFWVPTGAEVANVEIRNRSGYGPAISISGGTIDRVIARSTTDNQPTCDFTAGVVRSSACINSGGASAIGTDVLPGGPLERSLIRNSTFIATGPGSIGMEFIYYAGKVEIDVIGALIKGEARDVVARALKGDTAAIPGFGPRKAPTMRIELRASSYTTVETESARTSTASITPPGSNGNVTAMPLLADDNLHQLPGSPTIDKGAVDAASGPFDVNGWPRLLGATVDIGADEFGFSPPRGNSAPVTKLTMPALRQPIRTPSRKAEFSFGSSEIGSRFECKLDRKPYRACTSPHGVEVKLGKHEFRVRAIDPQGKADATPPVFRWKVVPLRVFLR